MTELCGSFVSSSPSTWPERFVRAGRAKRLAAERWLDVCVDDDAVTRASAGTATHVNAIAVAAHELRSERE
jgi:hypothetical protein